MAVAAVAIAIENRSERIRRAGGRMRTRVLLIPCLLVIGHGFSNAVASTVQSASTTITGIEDITESSDQGFFVKTGLASALNANCANSNSGWYRVTASTKADLDRLFAIAFAAYTNGNNVVITVESTACSNNYQQLVSIRMLP